MNKAIANAAVNEAINQVAAHYGTTPEMVRVAMASGNEKIRAYVVKIASTAARMVAFN